MALTGIQSTVLAQKSAAFLPEKPGKWKFDYNIAVRNNDEIKFKDNITTLAEWFHQNLPLLTHPKGFNLWAYAAGMWDDHYQISDSNYGLRAELNFNFQLFTSNGEIWTAELPKASYYSFQINNTQGALNYHGQFAYFNNLQDDQKLGNAINEAASKLDDIKIGFPFKEELAPGVHLYEETPGSDRCHIVVFNPERPPYWIPVTIKELAAIYLEYYSLFQKQEINQMILKELKDELSRIPEDELNSPAHSGHDSNIVFRFNGRTQEGQPLVKFNPDYWDRTLPASAIQLMTFWYPRMSRKEMDEQLIRFGYPVNSQILINQINWGDVAGLIMKGK